MSLVRWFDRDLAFDPGGSSDVVAPVVTATFPTTSDGLVVISAIDASSALASIEVSVKLTTAGTEEVIYRGAAFVAPYAASSTASGDSSVGVGRTLNIRRDGNWPQGSIAAFWVVAIDVAGNTSSGSAFVWSVPADGIGQFVPAAPVPAGQIDHVTAALDRLPQQFRTKAKIRAMLAAFARPGQAIEQALSDLLLKRFDIDAAAGVQLDALGRIVGEPRGGKDDPTYRIFLHARVAANRSRGTTEDMIRVLVLLLLGVPGVRISVQTDAIATCVINLFGAAITDALADIVISFAGRAALAGVRVLVTSSTVAPSARLTYDIGPGLDVGVYDNTRRS